MTDVTRGSHDLSTLVETLASTPDLLEAAVRGTEQAALDSAPEGEWSVRTILAHLRDDEFMVMRVRLARMTVEEHPTLTPFDEKAWAASRWTGRDGAEELLADFRLQREASMMVVRRLEDDDWKRTGLQPEIGVFDAHWWLEHWVHHDEIHLAQIKKTLAKAAG
jgi:hypothetical protein